MHSFITPLNPDISPLITIEPDTTSIGIKQIRQLLSQLANTSSMTRLVLITPADTLTTEASNALLKVLEEPPHNTIFYLATNSPLSLLPTIRSRCQIIKNSSHLTSNISNLTLIKSSLSLSPGDRLTLTQTLGTDRATLLTWTASLMQEVSQTIKSTSSTKSLQILAKIGTLLAKLHSELSANTSTSLSLGNFFLHLPKVK